MIQILIFPKRSAAYWLLCFNEKEFYVVYIKELFLQQK